MITPVEAEKLNEDDRKEASRLETEIDRQLVSNHRRLGDNVLVSIPSISQKAIDEVLKGYHESGWDVTYHKGNVSRYDPTDSDTYYIFKPIK